ncbi:contractile injection system protein, VgrG/Pvc8 family [Acetivibrio ethanolgignens]|uniref:Gp5/Type VI secretion system Vgr protein OB-fold domain-containing protein n=1 Tax=Acetivibrio ethanolgignens TaxID=290052 RepID=A0A0V8QDE8_9FIRM|nr:contractile injection system protein, VgrG/Pvc8 family [Acetivibrio ethanolgignens]KSV58607.1 hypothetical protein ASU35_12145 [Acetivibrio ethanolgignens]
MGYTPDQIVVEGVPIEQLEDIEFLGSAGEHGCLTLRGYVRAGDGEPLLFHLPQYSPLTIRAEGRLLFSGIIMKFLVKGKGDVSSVQVTAYSRSILMDQEKRCRSFQDTTMTYRELAEQVLREYPGSDIQLAFPDTPVSSIAVQYQETDWQFLKRLFSYRNAPLTSLSTSETLKLYAGVPLLPDTDCGFEMTGFRKELGEYYYWKQAGKDVRDDQFLIMEGRTEEVIGLFEQIETKGQSLSVREHGFRLEHGRLVGTCGIQKPEGILVKTEYPAHLTGAALVGTVLEVSGIQIRVHLKIDDGRDSNDVYWFPFSTLSASSDGSGWYYMPEQGDQVRVYFPTRHTSDAVAISAVSDYKEEGGVAPDRMGDPSTKYLSNPSGQELRMGKDGIKLACQGGSASVMIGNGGDISLYAEDTLLIQASNNVELTSETEMEFSAENTAVVACAMGGCLQMHPGGVLMLQGTEVKVD